MMLSQRSHFSTVNKYLKSWFDENKRLYKTTNEKHTIKPLVYKLWVSDGEIETGNEKEL